jgi:hypothetical protein
MHAFVERSQDLDEAAIIRLFEQGADDGIRQHHFVGDLRGGFVGAHIDHLEHQSQKVVHRDARVLNPFGRGRKAVQRRFELLGRDEAEGDEIIAEKAAFLLLALECLFDILLLEDSPRHQDPTQRHSMLSLAGPLQGLCTRLSGPPPQNRPWVRALAVRGAVLLGPR